MNMWWLSFYTFSNNVWLTHNIWDMELCMSDSSEWRVFRKKIMCVWQAGIVTGDLQNTSASTKASALAWITFVLKVKKGIHDVYRNSSVALDFYYEI